MYKIKRIFIFLLIINLCQKVYCEELLYLTEYQQEYKKFIENYLGYYIISYRPSDILILKLSLNRLDLIIHEMTIENNELFEVDRIVLDRTLNNNDNEMMFINSNSDYNFRNPIRMFRPPYVYYNPNNLPPPFPENFAIGYRSENRGTNYRLTLKNTLFTPDSNEAIEIGNIEYINNIQRRYTGRFILNNYEIIDIKYFENPIENDFINYGEINVYLANNDFLYTSNMKFSDRDVMFYAFPRAELIWGLNVSGENSGYSFKYYFENLNTIIYEYSGGRLNENGEWGTINYRLIYKREI